MHDGVNKGRNNIALFPVTGELSSTWDAQGYLRLYPQIFTPLERDLYFVGMRVRGARLIPLEKRLTGKVSLSNRGSSSKRAKLYCSVLYAMLTHQSVGH